MGQTAQQDYTNLTGKIFQDTNKIDVIGNDSKKYWVNYQGSCYIATIVDEISIELLSNRKLDDKDTGWKDIKNRPNWHTKEVLVNEVSFF